MEYTYRYGSPLGGILLTGDGEKLTGLQFDGPEPVSAAPAAGHDEKDLPVIRETCAWLDRYFSGRDPGQIPPLALQGTAFRQAVWEALLRIPYGQTATYGQLADSISEKTGKRVSARAVGGAAGHNPILLIVPCHRVVGANGALTGYAAGIDRKEKLLRMEMDTPKNPGVTEDDRRNDHKMV